MKLGKQNATNGHLIQARIDEKKYYALSSNELDQMIAELTQIYGRKSDVLRAAIFVLYGLNASPSKATKEAREFITRINEVLTKRGVVVRGEQISKRYRKAKSNLRRMSANSMEES